MPTETKEGRRWKFCEFCDAKVSPYPEPDRCPHCHKPVTEACPVSELEAIRKEAETDEKLVVALEQRLGFQRERADAAEKALKEGIEWLEERAGAERDERGELWRIGDAFDRAAAHLRNLATKPKEEEETAAITVRISLEGAKSFVSDSPGWGAMGLQEVTEALLDGLIGAGHQPPYKPTEQEETADAR